MVSPIPPVPRGSGEHPIIMLAVAANDLAASTAFYHTVFGWQFATLGHGLAAAGLPSGPAITLRANTPAGQQGVVPFVAVPDITAALAQAVQAGGTIERDPWSAPMIGTLARITDPAGTVYGLSSAISPGPTPHIAAPFGDAPRPPVNTACSLEMHAGDLDIAASFLSTMFGWGTLPTMPGYLMFDAGAGIGGVVQSHTPATRGLAYIHVADVAATLAVITDAGGTALGPPMPLPGMTTFGYFTDPSGTAMGLMG